MTVLTRVARGSYKAIPWANGKGITHEIGRDCLPWSWRLSMAELAPPGGAFSELRGVDRVLTLLDGDLQLRVGSSPLTKVQRFVPFAFPGDVKTDSIVTRKGLDLNVMYNRDETNASVTVASPDSEAWQVAVPEDEGAALWAISLGRPLELCVESEFEEHTLNLESFDSCRVEIQPERRVSPTLKLRIQGQGSKALFVAFSSKIVQS